MGAMIVHTARIYHVNKEPRMDGGTTLHWSTSAE
jgi:hypothetical protein